MTDQTVREVVLTGYRSGADVAPSSCVEVRDGARRELSPGEVRVRTSHQLLAAAFADLMLEDPPLPMPGYRPGEPIAGPCVGVVVESVADAIAEGTLVQHSVGWREEAVLPADQVFPLPDSLPSPEYALNQGVTAYHGMVDVAEVGDGDVVFVSGAAGGVGSLAVQIATLRGAAKVIATAGSAAKCRYLVDELGVDVAIDYKREDVAVRLGEEAPDGIDVFFDLVGGTQFEAAVPHAAEHARFALCGALAEQVGGTDGRPRLDVLEAILHEIKILPFRTLHTPDQITAWNAAYGEWMSQGKLVVPNTVIDGTLETAVAALDDLLAGKHHGNVVVRLS